MKWLEGNRIQVDPPRKPKKCTGTRFASVMGLNPWSSPFRAWCEITRTYEEPFEDTIYTIAGKTIEPKQAAYMKEHYFMRNLISPTDKWGPDYFKKTYGDFFHDFDVIGGMWDYILTDPKGKPSAVLEMKTSKRVEDWQDEIPEYYALQAALYAYMLGVDHVYMVATFLDESDYEHPEDFICNDSNTIVRPFLVSERYGDFFAKYVAPVIDWWEEHVLTGISPEYDEKRDADVLKELRTIYPDVSTDTEALVREAEDLLDEINSHEAAIEEKRKRYDAILKSLKTDMVEKFTDGVDRGEISGSRYTFVVSTSQNTTIDKDALKADGLFDKYAKVTPSYRITVKGA